MKNKILTDKEGEVRELTTADFKRMGSADDVLPFEFLECMPKRRRGERGPQKAPKKISVTIRYSPEVIDYFKSTGKGWQLRMDSALREWVSTHNTH